MATWKLKYPVYFVCERPSRGDGVLLFHRVTCTTPGLINHGESLVIFTEKGGADAYRATSPSLETWEMKDAEDFISGLRGVQRLYGKGLTEAAFKRTIEDTGVPIELDVLIAQVETEIAG